MRCKKLKLTAQPTTIKSSTDSRTDSPEWSWLVATRAGKAAQMLKSEGKAEEKRESTTELRNCRMSQCKTAIQGAREFPKTQPGRRRGQAGSHRQTLPFRPSRHKFEMDTKRWPKLAKRQQFRPFANSFPIFMAHSEGRKEAANSLAGPYLVSLSCFAFSSRSALDSSGFWVASEGAGTPINSKLQALQHRVQPDSEQFLDTEADH